MPLWVPIARKMISFGGGTRKEDCGQTAWPWQGGGYRSTSGSRTKRGSNCFKHSLNVVEYKVPKKVFSLNCYFCNTTGMHNQHCTRNLGWGGWGGGGGGGGGHRQLA